MDNTMSQKWDFLAPQFVDFSKPVDESFEEGENPEEYFNFDHENNIPLDIVDETAPKEESQLSVLSTDQQTVEENTDKDECSSSSYKYEAESDDAMTMSTLKINKPSIHLSSSGDSQEEAKSDNESQSGVHPVVKTTPVSNDEDIPAPPKTTEELGQLETPTEENKTVSTDGDKPLPTKDDEPVSTTEDRQVSTEDDVPEKEDSTSVAPSTTEEEDSLETDSLEDDSTDLRHTKSKSSVEVSAEAPAISLPAFNPGIIVNELNSESEDHLEKSASSLTESSTSEKEEVVKDCRPVNLVTSWTISCNKTEQCKDTGEVPAPIKAHMPVNLVSSWNKTSDTKTSTSKPVKKPTQIRRGSDSQVDGNHRVTRSMTRPRRSLRVKPRRSNDNNITVNSTSNRTPLSKRRRTDMNLTVNTKPVDPLKLTMPQTPTFMKRKMHFMAHKPKNTEELEMERINTLQKQMANTRKMAEESYKRLQVSTKYVPIRSQLPTTQPKEFDFHTDTRVTRSSTTASQFTDKDFVSTLRKHSDNQKKPKGPTKPQPFKFTTAHQKGNDDTGVQKRNDDTGVQKRFRSMAEQVAAFQVKTPERFQSMKRKQQNRGPAQPVLPNKLTITCPKTPALETRKRKRPSTVVSAKDKEDKEVEDMKSYQFKANPVDPRVLSNDNIGVVPVHKEPTKPVGFAFHSSKRYQERESDNLKQEDERVEFHARPVPAKILQGVTGLPDAKQIPATCPKSPAFALKNRKRVHEIEVKTDEEFLTIKSRPVPQTVPFVPNLPHKTTEVKPFSFAQRDEENALKKEEKIQQVFKEEQKLREFKAQLMPILDTVSGVPIKKPKKTTEAKPFGLSRSDVGAKRAEEWSRKMAEELEAERHLTFHAKEANVLYKKPFIPHKSDKPLTEINDFTLNSDVRAEQRQQYEAQKKMREHDLALQKAEIEKQNALREQKEIEEMRASMVHKPNPIRHYKPVEIERSNRPLTEPKTPNFSDRFKDRTIL